MDQVHSNITACRLNMCRKKTKELTRGQNLLYEKMEISQVGTMVRIFNFSLSPQFKLHYAYRITIYHTAGCWL